MKRREILSKKQLVLVMLAVLLSFVFGTTAMAASKTVNMKKDTNGTLYYMGSAEGTVYHKITVKKDGVLLVSGFSKTGSGSTRGVNIWLCNSKKKSLEIKSAGTYVGSQTAESFSYYGVKKGTYYIKVKNQPYYCVAARVQTVADKGASSKGKATTIKQNKTMKGLMPAGESATKADWYKFKVTSKKVLNLKLQALGTGSFRFYLYGPSYKNGILIDTLLNTGGEYVSVNSRRAKIKVKPGTYYIKVVRGTGKSKKASGFYSVRWNLK